MIGFFLCLIAAKFLYEVPMHGSFLVILLASILYLFVSLGIGLVLSAITKNQFLAGNNWNLIFKNCTILIAPVIVQSMLFGHAATFNLEKVPYALLDLSRSETSTNFIAKLEGGGVFQRVKNLGNSNEIAAVIDSGEVLLVVAIPPNFSQSLLKEKATSIQVWKRAGIFLPDLMGLLSLIQVLMLSGLSVAREREQGTFDQLLVTPLSPFQILIGKAVAPVVIGIFQAMPVFLICRNVFEIPFNGSLPPLYLTLLIFTLSCTEIGLSNSAISSSM